MSATKRGAERRPDDAYYTPAWMTRAILPYLWPPASLPPRILEPAAGDGAITAVLRERWPITPIVEIDVRPIRPGIVRCADFLTLQPDGVFDLVISNPPYALAMEFVQHALKFVAGGGRSYGQLVMLLRLNFLGAQRRAAWLRAHMPSVFVSPRRPSFTPDGKTDAIEYAWFIWGPQPPKLTILPTELI